MYFYLKKYSQNYKTGNKDTERFTATPTNIYTGLKHASKKLALLVHVSRMYLKETFRYSTL